MVSQHSKQHQTKIAVHTCGQRSKVTSQLAQYDSWLILTLNTEFEGRISVADTQNLLLPLIKPPNDAVSCSDNP